MAVSTRHTDRQAGFTLVEILCVLALLGLTAGLVILNLPKPAPAIETEAQALATTLNLAAQESVIDGRPRAVDITAGHVELLRYEGEWVSERRRDFGFVQGLALRVDGEDVDFKIRAKSKVALPPLIHFDATGNVTPFTLELRGRDRSFLLSPDRRGRIRAEVES